MRIPIDPVDRPKLGHHNLLGVVLDVNEVGQYKVGTKAGILPQRFTWNQLAPCDSTFLSTDDIPASEISFRSAVGAESVTGTQGSL